MRKKTVSGLLSTLLLLGMLTLAFRIPPARASNEVDTIIHVDPPLSSAVQGEAFTVDIMIDNVAELYAWQVNMSFDPNILEFVSWVEGDFLADQPEGTWNVSTIEEDHMLIGVATLGPYLGVSGSGWLMAATFRVLGMGESVLNIDNDRTILIKYNPPPLPPGGSIMELIPHIRRNGYFITAMRATIDVDPDTLNLRSGGQRVTCYIELSEGYDVGDIDVSTIMLNDTISISLLDVPAPDAVPTEIGDYDGDGIPDLTVAFDKKMVSEFILSQGIAVGCATLTITGEVAGTPFRGEDTIEVILGSGGPRDASDHESG